MHRLRIRNPSGSQVLDTATCEVVPADPEAPAFHSDAHSNLRRHLSRGRPIVSPRYLSRRHRSQHRSQRASQRRSYCAPMGPESRAWAEKVGEAAFRSVAPAE